MNQHDKVVTKNFAEPFVDGRRSFPIGFFPHLPVTSNLAPPPYTGSSSSMLTRSASVPEYLSTLSRTELTAAKSHPLNIFRTNSSLSMFYPDSLSLLARNSNQTKDLQVRSGIFSIQTRAKRHVAQDSPPRKKSVAFLP